MLKMKSACEKCKKSLEMTGLAYICSFECTFCETCKDVLSGVCPNCSGELLKRPTRMQKPLQVAANQIKRKLFGK